MKRSSKRSSASTTRPSSRSKRIPPRRPKGKTPLPPRTKPPTLTVSKPVASELGLARRSDPDDGADQQHSEEDQAGDTAALAEGGVADHHRGDREEEADDHAHIAGHPIQRGRRASR